LRYGTRINKKQVWFTDDEIVVFLDKVKKSGMTQSNYIRYCTLNKEIKEKPDDRFYDFLKYVRSISNNINQLTMKAHSLGYIDELEYKDEKNKLDNLIDEIINKYL